MAIPKEVTAFIRDLLGRSPRTKQNYTSFCRIFWGSVGAKSMGEITVDDVMAFLNDGYKEKGWKPSTVKQYARVALLFFNEFRDEEFLKQLKKQLRMLPRTQPPHSALFEGIYVPPNKIDLFIASAPDEEYAVLYTMILKWGLRLGEALQQSPADVDPEKNRVVVRGKGVGGFGKIRQVFVEKSTITRVLTFAKCNPEQTRGEKPIRDTNPIIKTIKARTAEYQWKKTAKKVGLEHWQRLTPHDGRHSYAIDFLIKRKHEGMAALVLLKNQLGHSSIKTTEIYLDIAGSEARDVFDAGLQSSNTETMINISEAK